MGHYLAHGILYKHIHEPPPTSTALNPDLSPALEPVLLKALTEKREERYQSAGELAWALRQAVEAEEQSRQRNERLGELYGQLREAFEAQDWVTAEAQCREIQSIGNASCRLTFLWPLPNPAPAIAEVQAG